MQPIAITLRSFNSVPEGVTQIQNRAQATFALILRDYIGFVFTGALYRIGQRAHITGK